MTREIGIADRRSQDESALHAIRAEPVFRVKSLVEANPDQELGVVQRLVGKLAETGWLTREKRRDGVWFCWNGDPARFSPSAWMETQTEPLPIAASPAADRPRERLLALGPTQLRIAELLAILIRSGRTGESALQAGERLAQVYADRLERLATARPAELKTHSPAIGNTAYCQIMAGIELGRRLAALAQTSAPPTRITGSAEAIAYCREQFARLIQDACQEEFHIVCLDTKHQVLGTHRIFVGTLNASLVHPREIFRAALRDAAHSILLVHNHPSGDPTPSREDFAATERLEKSGELLGVQVLDHIVVARSHCVSIRESR